MIELKKNERLVRIQDAKLRAPDGISETIVPQYIIITVDENDPTINAEVEENKQLVYGGHMFGDKKRAEERFNAIMAGREPPPRDPGTPIYLAVDAESIDPKTERTHESEKIIGTMAKEFKELFALHRRKEIALSKQKK